MERIMKVIYYYEFKNSKYGKWFEEEGRTETTFKDADIYEYLNNFFSWKGFTQKTFRESTCIGYMPVKIFSYRDKFYRRVTIFEYSIKY